jgi:hypothetical protein
MVTIIIEFISIGVFQSTGSTAKPPIIKPAQGRNTIQKQCKYTKKRNIKQQIWRY